jgi:hypothetical protein
MSFRILTAILIFATSTAGVQAQPAPEQVYARIVTDFIRPGFAALAAEARQHAAAWQAYCRAPSARELEKLATSFQSFADSWAGIEIIRSGPAAEDFRHERFYFWPERKNAVERGLNALLSQSPALDAAAISKQSAAVQGLPALERLLYADGRPDAQLGTGQQGKIGCAAGEAISANAAGIAAEMAAAWAADPGTASPEARAALATDVVTAYAILKDSKIEAVIGKDENLVKPRAAEFWRSGRPMRNIILNFEALARLNDFLFPNPSEDVALPYATMTVLGIAEATGDLADTARGKKRRDAIFLLDAAAAAQDRAIIEVPLALGVTIGFNSLDGD